jgi:hypothetical protein
MQQAKMRGLLTAGVVAMLAGLLRAEEIIALYTFNDMGALNDGTTRVVKETSVGLAPTLALVEADAALIDTNGSNGTAFTDADGVGHAANPSAAWSSGLVGAGNAGKNYFELECSTLGFRDLVLSLDAFSSATVGPGSLALTYAAGDGEYQPLGTLALTRDTSWHRYTHVLGAAELEHAARVRIRGTWSADATSGSGRLDNLQLTGTFTNGLGRAALYAFTGSSRTNRAFMADVAAGLFTGVNVSGSTYTSSNPNTASGPPAAAVSEFDDQPRTRYLTFRLTPSGGRGISASHLRGYFATGSGTGTMEATMLVNGTEYSLGTAGVNSTIAPKVFRVPPQVPPVVTTSVDFRLYGWGLADTNTTLRMDDVEVIGTTETLPTNTVVARFPFTGSAVTNTAGNVRVGASAVTSSGTGTVGFYTGIQFEGSESGIPALSVTGLDGDAQDRYVAFDLTPRRDTRLTPTLISLYARAGSGIGTVQASVVVNGVEHPLGALTLDSVVRLYCFSVHRGWVPPIAAGSAQVRLYGWGFASDTTTLRIDDWTVEGTLEDLPPKGTIIRIH